MGDRQRFVDAWVNLTGESAEMGGKVYDALDDIEQIPDTVALDSIGDVVAGIAAKHGLAADKSCTDT